MYIYVYKPGPGAETELAREIRVRTSAEVCDDAAWRRVVAVVVVGSAPACVREG